MGLLTSGQELGLLGCVGSWASWAVWMGHLTSEGGSLAPRGSVNGTSDLGWWELHWLGLCGPGFCRPVTGAGLPGAVWTEPLTSRGGGGAHWICVDSAYDLCGQEPGLLGLCRQGL